MLRPVGADRSLTPAATCRRSSPGDRPPEVAPSLSPDSAPPDGAGPGARTSLPHGLNLLAPLDRGQGLEHAPVERVLHEAHGAVCEEEVGPPAVGPSELAAG